MSEEFKNQFHKEGWVCPKCGNVMSPTQAWCVFCVKSEPTITTNIPFVSGLNTGDFIPPNSTTISTGGPYQEIKRRK